MDTTSKHSLGSIQGKNSPKTVVQAAAEAATAALTIPQNNK
jgi:hypothetical protein